jgi:aryl-alcohol dehydrogenase-like predicted oxidoreductase
MEKRRLGENGPLVAPMGLGCMSFGGVYGPTDQAESHRTLARAIDLGLDHLDVADVYGEGRAEEVLGAFLKDNAGRFTIATKAGIKRKPTRSFDNSPEHLRAALEGSLRRLGVDHIPLFYVHRRDQSVQIEDVMETMVRFREEGKIGAIGLSEISPATLRRASAVHPVAAVQSEYSLWTRLPDLGLVAACAEAGAALVAFSPLGRGMFCGAPIDPLKFVPSDFRNGNPRFVQPNLDHNRAYAERFAAFARERGCKPAALAIAWVLARAPHIIPIPGTRTPDHLADDFAGTAIRLGAGDMAAIEAILPSGFAHGDRYSEAQSIGTERYC